ncbi:MAG: DUF3999 family protein [Syntrophaceae bacterium]|nr:DUF3999 family protein [Syntrophaceae bacterium]
MKRKIVSSSLVLLCVVFYCPAKLWAGRIEPSNFRYSAILNEKIKKGAFYRVILPGAILEGCERFGHDIRIFDKENREIPFVVLDNRIPPKKTNRYALEVLSYDDQATRTKIVLKRPNPITPVNRMEIDSPDRDFNKAVTVSGSSDLKNWKTLARESIYDFSSRVNLRKMYLQLGNNTYPYFQLIIDEEKEKGIFQNIKLKFNGMDFSASMYTKKKLKVSRFVVLDDTEGHEKVIYDEFKLLPSVLTDPTKRVTEIEFNSVLPFSALEFAIDHPYYCRPVRLYGTATGRKKDSVLIKQDSLYSFPISNQEQTKKHIDIPMAQGYRSYRVVIENDVNPPLKIEAITLRWAQKQLFFIGLDDHQEYRLFWGSPTVEEGNYDIAKMIRADNWFNQPTLSIQISPIAQNPGYRPFKGKDDKSLIEKNILVIVIILVVIVVAFFLFQLWKKTA